MSRVCAAGPASLLGLGVPAACFRRRGKRYNEESNMSCRGLPAVIMVAFECESASRPLRWG